MKVTGYKLQHAIRVREQVQKLLTSVFEASLLAFPGEPKNPVAEMQKLMSNEASLVALQEAQAQYNQTVLVQVPWGTITLSEAVKSVRGVGRIEKLWCTAAQGKKPSAGMDANYVRRPDDVYAESTIQQEEALKKAKETSQRAAALREAIQTGNSTEVEISWLDQSLFE